MSQETEALFRQALEDVADDREVDWEGLVSREPGLEERLGRLRRAAETARGQRSSGEDASEVDRRRQPLFTWGHLQILGRLGEGAFGEVYRAYDPTLDREVALKLRRSGPSRPIEGGRAYLDEARRLASLRHPNVVAVHGADVHDGRVGLWTDLLEGRTLEEWIHQEGPCSAREAALIGLELCRALAAVSSAGLVHGDLKTTNVMRERGGRIVLMDFGAVTEADRAPLAAVGSPLAMAPELLRGASPGQRSDLYALGALLYRLVTGCHPVAGRTVEELVEAHQRGAAVPILDRRPDLPRAFVAAVERALEPDPQRRFQSAGEMERALAEAATASGGGGEGTTSSGTGVILERAPSRSWLAHSAAIGVGVLLAAGGLLGWYLLSSSEPGAPPQLEASADAGRPEPPFPQPTLEASPAAEPGVQSSPVVESREPSVAAAAHAAATAYAPLQVEAAFYRDANGRVERLSRQGEVAPGDHLYLELSAAEPIHVYVLNEDLQSGVYLLFPLPVLDLANPLAAGGRHRLPGTQHGMEHDWLVTTAGGEERFLVVASRHRLLGLEEELASFEAARAQEPPPSVTVADDVVLRGVGGLAPTTRAHGTGAGFLDRLERHLEAKPAATGIWIERFTLRNPGSAGG